VTVKNIGDLEGSTTVDLLVNGVKEQSKAVTLAGGASTTVIFKVSSQAEGTHGAGRRPDGQLQGDEACDSAADGPRLHIVYHRCCRGHSDRCRGVPPDEEEAKRSYPLRTLSSFLSLSPLLGAINQKGILGDVKQAWATPIWLTL